ncbi:hypothetical protein [uncultured Streptococcus sp.]|nr:hypothetical protein [uncultured Streptococcus sp.]
MKVRERKLSLPFIVQEREGKIKMKIILFVAILAIAIAWYSGDNKK